MDAKEKLIAKIQVEYATHMGGDWGIFYENYDMSALDWEIGLLYMTTMHMWFINAKKEKSKVPLKSVAFISEIYPIEGKRTRFSEVMNATHMFHISYIGGGEDGRWEGGLRGGGGGLEVGAVFLTAQRSVLEALRAQLKIRAAAQYQRYYEKWKNRKISTLLYLGIRDEARLAYYLNMSTEDLLNMIMKRNVSAR